MRLKTWAPFAVVGVILSTGCGGGPPPGQPAPENLPALESELSRNPRDAGLATRVGIAYYDAKQYDRARDVLRSALVLGEQNYPARVYLGLTYEELGQLDSARAEYTKAATQTSDSRRRGEIQDRLTLLTQKELRAQAKDAIAHEAALSSQPPTENAVAVFPFRYVGSNADLAPIGRGLTHLMITDLAKVSRLRLLEREQVQALVDEMALNDAGRVDPATGARSGRMLRAARVLQGSVQDVPGRTQIKLDAAMVNSANASVVASGSASDQLQQLFALQKQVLLALVQQMGIALSPAEQRALTERPTADLQAFLAFSRGLEAEDRGDWKSAEASFSAAVARDPNFRAAKDKQQTAQRVAATQQVTATQLAGAGEEKPGETPPPSQPSNRWSVLRDGVLNTVPSVGSTLVNRLGPAPVSRVPTTRPDLPEATGADGPGGSLFGTIVIIITRP
jgi:TolB-like protein